MIISCAKYKYHSVKEVSILRVLRIVGILIAIAGTIYSLRSYLYQFIMNNRVLRQQAVKLSLNIPFLRNQMMKSMFRK